MAGFLALLFCLAPLSGCFGENVDSTISEGDVTVTPKVWIGGEFQAITIAAESDVSVFVPYLMLNPENGFVQNSTVVDIKAGKSVQLTVLAPPRTDTAVVLIGEYGREDWPIRDLTESWRVWYARDGFNRDDNQGVSRVSSNTSLDAVLPSTNNGGEVIAIRLGIERPFAAAYSEPEGGRHSMGLVDGRTVLNYINVMSDETPDPLDLADGAVGYLDRWAGQGNAAYEDGAQYLIKELEGFGLEVINQRFVYDSVNTGQQNPEAYNICGYRFGEVDPDKWMVFGAHFDIAPPVNGGMISPHLIGERTYGTRVGAYDNTAGTSMVLTVAEAMAGYSTRNTMVFCLWSGEEGGKRGSDYWTEEWVKEDNPNVEVTNYVNLDMAGVNWPGGGGAPCGGNHGGGEPNCDPDPQIDPDGYPKDEEVWPMRVYIGPSLDHDVMNQPGMVNLALWIGSDAIGVEEQMSTLIGTGYDSSTWKVDDWLAKDRPEIIVYEDTTARSDHASFQDNLGTVTMGFGGLVDGYWCYHQTCDTVDEMIDWMDTTGKDYGEERSGTSNLVDALDTITWWATYSFFHLDENPVRSEYLE
tara:strand:+ start:739 stop:2484 length:1746 start_codon:yes stop_codon:yes gene_type:complete